MTFDQTQQYDDALVALLELVWGEGFMSPGGPDEIKMIVAETDLSGRKVLDIGCGSGGIDQYLAETFAPEQIVGIDVDAGIGKDEHQSACLLRSRTSCLHQSAIRNRASLRKRFKQLLD